MKYIEMNFDGLVGPLHNYAGLASGNLASCSHSGDFSHPKKAALQGLDKMAAVRDRGLQQGFIPPQRRPDLETLKDLGYREGLKSAGLTSNILRAVCSSSSMWVANAATVIPSVDSNSDRLSFLVANLFSHFHRSIEPKSTQGILSHIFPRARVFSALPSTPDFGDEGAANHTRLGPTHSSEGIHLFVYGVDTFDEQGQCPERYEARQTRAACEASVRLLGLNADRVIYAQQNPKAIDEGVFHNDVISTGNNGVFLYHEDAFCSERTIEEIKAKYLSLYGKSLQDLEVSRNLVSLKEAVSSYLFNSQLVTLPTGSMLLIAPIECRDMSSVRNYIDEFLIAGDNDISEVVYLDLRESMRNGGGPACLRLRVQLNEDELREVHPGVILTDTKEAELRKCVSEYYPDKLTPEDLVNPEVLMQASRAHDALEKIIGFKI